MIIADGLHRSIYRRSCRLIVAKRWRVPAFALNLLLRTTVACTLNYYNHRQDVINLIALTTVNTTLALTILLALGRCRVRRPNDRLQSTGNTPFYRGTTVISSP